MKDERTRFGIAHRITGRLAYGGRTWARQAYAERKLIELVECSGSGPFNVIEIAPKTRHQTQSETLSNVKQ